MKNILLIILLLSILSCHKETETDVVLAQIKQLKFACSGIHDSIYFACKLNNSDYCLSHGFEQCYALSELGSYIFTTGNTINTSDTTISRGKFLRLSYNHRKYDSMYNRATTLLTPDIDITGPVMNKNISYHTHCERFLKQGTCPIRGFGMNDSIGFQFLLSFSFKKTDSYADNYSAVDLVTTGGEQSSTDKITFDEVTKWDARGQYHYFVKGRISCKLYRITKVDEPGEFFYKVENAAFTHQFDVDK